ncbi:MAG: hypothetical protein J6I72_07115, partial [Muribaculaceae bacterium]|nr:hypothetical protein [Muribaculaceae bacterium]
RVPKRQDKELQGAGKGRSRHQVLPLQSLSHLWLNSVTQTQVFAGDPEIIREYIDVLNRPIFRFSPSLVQRFIEAWTELGVNALRIHSNEYFPDSSDAVFYEITLSKRGAYLVTGNKKHFPQSPIVVLPAEMLTIMGEMAQ